MKRDSVDETIQHLNYLFIIIIIFFFSLFFWVHWKVKPLTEWTATISGSNKQVSSVGG